MKWKIFTGVLIWIILAGLIHWTNVNAQIEHPDWGNSSQTSLPEQVWLAGFILSLPGMNISFFWPIRHGVPMFVEIFPVSEICNDIFYALLIGLIVWKFPPKSKKL